MQNEQEKLVRINQSGSVSCPWLLSGRVPVKRTRHKQPVQLDLVQSCWPNGHVKLGFVTEDSCAYVAKYMTKKLKGKSLEEKLKEDPDFQNEFVLMSRRPGIGSELSPAMIQYLRDNGIYYRKGVMSGLPRYWKEKFDIDVPRGKKHLINEVNACKIFERRLKFFKRKV